MLFYSINVMIKFELSINEIIFILSFIFYGYREDIN